METFRIYLPARSSLIGEGLPDIETLSLVSYPVTKSGIIEWGIFGMGGKMV